MNVIRPIVGEWYRGGTNELFEVVAIDDADETIEINTLMGPLLKWISILGTNICGTI
jgi:hypothetical protein